MDHWQQNLTQHNFTEIQLISEKEEKNNLFNLFNSEKEKKNNLFNLFNSEKEEKNNLFNLINSEK